MPAHLDARARICFGQNVIAGGLISLDRTPIGRAADRKATVTMPKLDGKVAVITGATSGMALATDASFVTGANLVVDGGFSQI
jgi:hypothetical protein